MLRACREKLESTRNAVHSEIMKQEPARHKRVSKACLPNTSSVKSVLLTIGDFTPYIFFKCSTACCNFCTNICPCNMFLALYTWIAKEEPESRSCVYVHAPKLAETRPLQHVVPHLLLSGECSLSRVCKIPARRKQGYVAHEKNIRQYKLNSTT